MARAKKPLDGLMGLFGEESLLEDLLRLRNQPGASGHPRALPLARARPEHARARFQRALARLMEVQAEACNVREKIRCAERDSAKKDKLLQDPAQGVDGVEGRLEAPVEA